MKRFERLGFATQREYREAPFEMYQKATYIEYELLIMEKLMKSIAYILFNEEENLYFLPKASVEKFQGTPFANVHYFYEEVVDGYIVTGEDLATLFDNINHYYYHERMELRRKENAKKVEEQLKLCEELKREQEEKEHITEIESGAKEKSVVECKKARKCKSKMNKEELAQLLIDNYLLLCKEKNKNKMKKYSIEMLKIMEILYKKDYIAMTDYSSYVSKIEHELNKDLDE